MTPHVFKEIGIILIIFKNFDFFLIDLNFKELNSWNSDKKYMKFHETKIIFKCIIFNFFFVMNFHVKIHEFSKNSWYRIKKDNKKFEKFSSRNSSRNFMEFLWKKNYEKKL